jgi:holo-[acyl-carrier protein] synthase
MRVVTGVDMIEIPRLRRVVERWGERFLRRVYTAGELEYCRGHVPSLAVRWAAKEAVYKALSNGPDHESEISWREIEVLSAENGHPEILLHGVAAARAAALRVESWSLSLSHTHEYAVAVAVALCGI